MQTDLEPSLVILDPLQGRTLVNGPKNASTETSRDGTELKR